MLSQLRSGWRALTQRNQFETGMAEEMRFHVERRAEDLMRAGLVREAAERQARIEFGGMETHREECRQSRGLRFLDELWQDLRYASRTMRRKPGFTVVALGSLALGIGANTAMFSVIEAVMLRTLAVERPQDLYSVEVESRTPDSGKWSWPGFVRMRDSLGANGTAAAMSRVIRMPAKIREEAEAQTAQVQLVSGEYFKLLGVPAAIGRTLSVADNKVVGGHPLAVISHGFWQRRLGGAASVVGSDLVISDSHFTIVGVARQGFTGVWLESPADVWIPAMMQREVRYSANYSANDSDPAKPWPPQDGISWLQMVARPGAGREASMVTSLTAELDRATARQAESISDTEERRLFLQRRVRAVSIANGFSNMRKQFGPPLMALMATVAMVLLIACANIANLLLARAAGRQREIAVRLSIGAGRGRLIRQLLTESLLLAAVGGIAGLLLGHWTSALLVRFASGEFTGPVPLDVGVNLRVLALTALIAMSTGLLFGLAPAMRSTAVDAGAALKSGARNLYGGSRLSIASLLVAAQVALSLLLVAGAGLFVQSFRNLTGVNPGYAPQSLLSVQFDPGALNYQGDRLTALYTALEQRVQGLPGVRSATIAMCSLGTGCRAVTDGIQISGYTRSPGEQVALQENRVTAGYFQTVGMQLLEGRSFEPRDEQNTQRVAVVNEAMARRYFRGRSPVGQKFGSDKLEVEIIGVVRNARVNAMREEPVPMAFYPIGQTPFPASALQIRVDGNPSTVANAVRKAIADVEPNLRIDRMMPVSELLDRTLMQDRLVATLTLLFGALALGLASFGLYGVMSYAVSRRTAELGVRLALGASRSQVLWGVMRESLTLAGMGLAVGVPLAFAGARLASGLLYGVRPGDPQAILIASAVLLTSAALSGYVPAWRASRVDPMVALRYE